MGSGPSGWDRCREEAAAEGQAESPVGHWDGTSLISLAGWSWTHCHLPWLPPELLLGSGKRTQRGFWREHRLKKWPGLGIRSRSPRPPHLIWPWGRQLSSPTSVPACGATQGECFQMCVWASRGGGAQVRPTCPGRGDMGAHFMRALPQSASLYTRGNGETEGGCPPGPQATELGGRGPSGVWPGVFLWRSPWLASTHSCDGASVSPFCKMLTAWHHLVGGGWESL